MMCFLSFSSPASLSFLSRLLSSLAVSPSGFRTASLSPNRSPDATKQRNNTRCPVDNSIFPSFSETGNALESSYEAFRFTESYGVIFQCNVKYCIGRCEPVCACVCECECECGSCCCAVVSTDCLPVSGVHHCPSVSRSSIISRSHSCHIIPRP